MCSPNKQYSEHFSNDDLHLTSYNFPLTHLHTHTHLSSRHGPRWPILLTTVTFNVSALIGHSLQRHECVVGPVCSAFETEKTQDWIHG